MDQDKIKAITFANALVYASPSHDKKSSMSKQKMWEKFINSISWDQIGKPKKSQDLLKMFGGANIPVIKKK